ncbi:hypothetical protein [Streptomyces carpaticus]|uniref:hypothetical protein n=1 Tax=Streptomyces carpaticus TaxID=285558 RepID=UPI0031F7C7F9
MAARDLNEYRRARQRALQGPAGLQDHAPLPPAAVRSATRLTARQHLADAEAIDWDRTPLSAIARIVDGLQQSLAALLDGDEGHAGGDR